MSELKAWLEAFSRGEMTLEAVSESLEDLVRRSPERTSTIRQELLAARSEGLPRGVTRTLERKLGKALQLVDEFAETTVMKAPILSPVARDATRSAPEASTQARAASPPAHSPVDPDATVMAPETLAEAAASRRSKPAVDPDATVMAPDPAGEVDIDVTQLGFEAPEESTDATATPDYDDIIDITSWGSDESSTDVTMMQSHESDPAIAHHARQPDDFNALIAGAASSDRTIAATDPDATQAVDFDIFEPSVVESPATAAEVDTGASWPTADPRAATATPGGAPDLDEFREGSMLRGRFELISKLGEGGMGAVWKGKDMLKVEARDRNPWVAIKLLQGDFKQHPEAFIALQRETSKQQRLAHPNIATVYDFDRDTGTGTVFMTMEVLDGQDLAGYIRKLPADGLPFEEAMPMIEQLCSGLSYAHQAGLVHSDLKPGNCFVTQDGRIKLLDFGIARASKTKADASGETTVFDPGELGALTPTYATVEMFGGDDPDPRDDIYALAIMAYQLLTGKHPYAKQSAPKAMEQGLVPATIPKISKRQNRALQRGLAFLRDNRTPSVEAFLEGLRAKKSYALHYAAAAAVFLIIVGGLVYKPIQDYLLEQRMNEVIALIARGDEQSIAAGVKRADEEFEEVEYKAILEDERAKDAIFGFYESRVSLAVDKASSLYDYPEAERQLAALKQLYPDSAQALRMDNTLQDDKDRELGLLSTKYNELLEAGALIPKEDGEDISDVLALVGQIDPDAELLSDKELPIKFSDFVQSAMDSGDFELADQYLKASIAYAPDDPALSNLRYTVETELSRRRDAIAVSEIQERLQAEATSFESLADFERVRDDLIKLADLDPSNQVLVSLQTSLKAAFTGEQAKLIEDGRWDDGEKLLVGFAKLLDIPFLTEQRASLSAAESKAGYALEMSEQRRAAIDERERNIEALLEAPRFDGEWETALKVPYKELIALLPSGDPEIEPLRDRTARLYLDKARESRAANRFAEASAFVTKGLDFYPGLTDFEAEQVAIAAAVDGLRLQQEDERRLAKLKKLKQQLIVDAKADKPQDAASKLEELRSELPGDDAFITAEAPEAIALSYQRLAAQQAEQGNFENAAKFAEAGLALRPELAELQEALAAYSKELAKIASIIEVKKMLGGTGALDVASLRQQVDLVKQEFPDRWGDLNREYGGLAEARIRQIEKTDVQAAHDLLASLKDVFPSISSMSLKPLPSTLAARGLKEVDSGELTAAQATLDEAIAKDGANHPDVEPLQAALRDRMHKATLYFNEAKKLKAQKQVRKAKQYLVDGAMKLWKDNPEYTAMLTELENTKSSAGTTSSKKGACTPKLAGYGSKSGGTCYDEVASKRGPVMVVVPAGGGATGPFAIGKYEVSIGDYNLYCAASKKCSGVAGDQQLPVTGISVKDAEEYATWLTSTTKAVYRLPTAQEWEYAASAEGKQPKKDFNCRVSLGDQLIKGHALVNASSGQQNGWGLANYVGNAQEWVKAPGGLEARGGAYEDSLSKCDISVTKSHAGSGDGLTGFRLVRELG